MIKPIPTYALDNLSGKDKASAAVLFLSQPFSHSREMLIIAHRTGYYGIGSVPQARPI